MVVLEGTLGFEAEGEAHELGAGDAVALPPGTRHRFRNAGDGHLRLLIIAAPGRLEAFFRDIDAGVDAAEAARRTGLELE